MKKQIGICTLITMLVLVAVSCTRHPAAEDHPESATATVTESVTNTATEYITNTTFITAVEEATDINWTKEEDGTVRLTPENLKAIRAVKELDISNMELTDLSGIEWFTGLEDLGCTGNYLTELDVSKNTKLQNLYCYKNQLRSLDLSQNTALEELYCHENQLGLLDLSHNTALTADRAGHITQSGIGDPELWLSEDIQRRDARANTDIDGGAKRKVGQMLGRRNRRRCKERLYNACGGKCRQKGTGLSL